MRAVFFSACQQKGCGRNVFFRAANNMRGAGALGAGGLCLRNYKLILYGLIALNYFPILVTIQLNFADDTQYSTVKYR